MSELGPVGTQVTDVEEDGVLLRGVLEVQCMGGVRDPESLELLEPCGTVIKVPVVRFADGECETYAVCPKCSQQKGLEVRIPVALLVGQDVADTLEWAEGEDEGNELDGTSAPFAGQVEQEGIGPLRMVTDEGDEVI